MRYSLLLVIFMVSCSQVKQVETESLPTPVPPDFEDLNKQFTVCGGEGIITSRGVYSGQLRFRFTSETDSTNIRFTDIIGRQVLEIIVVENNLKARDLLKNKWYSIEQITDKLPILKILSPRDLRDALWGIPPTLSDGIQSDMEIKLESEPTEYGLLLQRVIVTGNDKTRVVIQFLSRTMGYNLSDII